MKIADLTLQSCRYTILIGVFSIATAFGCSSNKVLTGNNVDRDIEETVQEAKEETQEAIESGEQYTNSNREARISELQNRMKDIDNRIEDLKKAAGESSIQSAVENVNRVITNLQDEKTEAENRLERVKAVEEQDWSAFYTEINEAVKKMEKELTKLSKSLEQK